MWVSSISRSILLLHLRHSYLLYIRYTYTTLGMVRILYYIERRYIMILMLGLVLGLTNFVLAFLCSLPVLCLPFFGKHTASTKKASTFHTCPPYSSVVTVKITDRMRCKSKVNSFRRATAGRQKLRR